MNAAMMVVCMAGSITAGQADAPVFRAGQIQVKKLQHGPDAPSEHHVLLYNRINIGTNFLKPQHREDYGNPEIDNSRLATTYFHTRGPVGIVLQRYNWFPGKENTYSADVRLPASLIGTAGLDPCGQMGQLGILWSEPPIAVIGMDVGTIASYARPVQTVHFFERVPTVVKLSVPDKGKERFFVHLGDALDRGANLRVFEGEPRVTIEKNGGDRFYQVIVVNTYHLPVVTVCKDLMTTEGMQMLMSKTCEDGILCFHTSNRYYDLVPIVASVAHELKYACLVGHDVLDDYQRGHFTSEWVVVARDQKYLAHLKAPEGYQQALQARGRVAEPFWSAPRRTEKKFVWTDKGENSFRGIYRSDPAVGEFGMALYDFERFITDYVGINYLMNRVSRPLHDAIRSWGIARAEILNRDPPQVKKTLEKENAPKK
jgi:hypothetical protein